LIRKCGIRDSGRKRADSLQQTADCERKARKEKRRGIFPLTSDPLPRWGEEEGVWDSGFRHRDSGFWMESRKAMGQERGIGIFGILEK